LDGSFLEDKEQDTFDSRPPNDIDVCTFFLLSIDTDFEYLKTQIPAFFSPRVSKSNFLVDHYPVDLNINPSDLVFWSQYWYQLFSHTRNGIWKGMLRLPLSTPKEDEEAIKYLNHQKNQIR